MLLASLSSVFKYDSQNKKYYSQGCKNPHFWKSPTWWVFVWVKPASQSVNLL